MREQMKEYIKTTDLIKTFTDMASRGSLLGKASQQDHLMQIIGAICNEAFKEDSDINESFVDMSYPVYKVYATRYPDNDRLREEITFRVGCMKTYHNQIQIINIDQGYVYPATYPDMTKVHSTFSNIDKIPDVLIDNGIINRIELLTHENFINN